MSKLGFIAVLTIACLGSSLAIAADQAARTVSLRDAIDLAVQNNLTIRLAKARTEEARGITIQSAAGLLPQISGTMSQLRIFKQNLAAEGFVFPNSGFPSVIGPYNSFDARFQLVQTILNFSMIKRYQSSRNSEEIAKLDEKLAAEQVSGASALAYVEALRGGQATQAAQADFDLAQALEKLAHDQHDAGVSTGIDVARAQTRSGQAKLRLLQATVAERQAQIRLKRVIGLPLGVPLQFSDSLQVVAGDSPQSVDAISGALQDRFEGRIAEQRVEADKAEYWAVEGERLPTVAVTGNYGLSGNLPNSAAIPTSSVGAMLQLPIWGGNHVHGEALAAEARKDESEAQRDDILAQIEEDVRLALEDITTANDRVQTADQVFKLAQRELQLARDRFKAGVGDNIELVNAQDSVALARNEQVAAIAQFYIARINLALATGHMGAFRL